MEYDKAIQKSSFAAYSWIALLALRFARDDDLLQLSKLNEYANEEFFGGWRVSRMRLVFTLINRLP
jgi:hypothetical protein